MQTDAVKQGNILSFQHFRKTAIPKLRPGLRRLAQQVRMRRMGRVKIGTGPAPRNCRRMDVYRHSLSKPQFTMAGSFVCRPHIIPMQQQAIALKKRTDIPVIPIRVCILGKISFIPHEADLQQKICNPSF